MAETVTIPRELVVTLAVEAGAVSGILRRMAGRTDTPLSEKVEGAAWEALTAAFGEVEWDESGNGYAGWAADMVAREDAAVDRYFADLAGLDVDA